MRVLRPAGSADVGALAELAARTMRESYAGDHDAEQVERHVRDTVSPSRIAAELDDPEIATFLAEEEGAPVGYATLRSGNAPVCVAASAPAELARIYVLRRCFRTGAGSALLDAALRECRTRGRDVLWLSVWDRNDRALAFYEAREFRRAGAMPFVFGGVEYEDLVLARPVDPEPGEGVVVRPLRADEGALLRRVRLAALRESPGAFLTTAAQAEQLPDEEWDRRARRSAEGEAWGIFLALADGETCGMAAGIRHPDRPGVVELVQMWVDPRWRRRGIGRRLVQAVLGWSTPRAERVRLGVADDQAGAIALYRSLGFVPTGETEPAPRGSASVLTLEIRP